MEIITETAEVTTEAIAKTAAVTVGFINQTLNLMSRLLLKDRRRTSQASKSPTAIAIAQNHPLLGRKLQSPPQPQLVQFRAIRCNNILLPLMLA